MLYIYRLIGVSLHKNMSYIKINIYITNYYEQ